MVTMGVRVLMPVAVLLACWAAPVYAAAAALAAPLAHWHHAGVASHSPCREEWLRGHVLSGVLGWLGYA